MSFSPTTTKTTASTELIDATEYTLYILFNRPQNFNAFRRKKLHEHDKDTSVWRDKYETVLLAQL